MIICWTAKGLRYNLWVVFSFPSQISVCLHSFVFNGYALTGSLSFRGKGFENAVKYVNTLLPTKEDIDSVRRKSISTFPIPAIREAIANSLIHQDFFITGAGPLRERFGVTESSSGSISRLIKEVLNSRLIKPVDPNTAPRYMKYIPIWGWFNLLATCRICNVCIYMVNY